MEKEAKILTNQKEALSSVNKLQNMDLKLYHGRDGLETKFEELEKRFEDHVNVSASIQKLGQKGSENLQILELINTDLKGKIAELCENNQKITADGARNTFDFMELNEKVESLETENKKLNRQVCNLVEQQRQVEESAKKINDKVNRS